MITKVIGSAVIACILILGYAGHNLTAAANRVGQAQVGQRSMLACATNAACNDPSSVGELGQ